MEPEFYSAQAMKEMGRLDALFHHLLRDRAKDICRREQRSMITESDIVWAWNELLSLPPDLPESHPDPADLSR